MHNTDNSGFDLRAPRGPNDSSCHLLGDARLTFDSPIDASRAVGWCSLRLSRGSSTSDADLRGCRLPATQALHHHHSLSRPEVSSGRPRRSLLVGSYGGRVHHPHVQHRSRIPSCCQWCCRDLLVSPVTHGAAPPLFHSTLVYCDNVCAIYLAFNPVQH
jgi:hypothetical protein